MTLSTTPTKKQSLTGVFSSQQTFNIYWRNGKKDQLVGASLREALVRANVAAFELLKVSFYETEDGNEKYEWDKQTGEWKHRIQELSEVI